METERIHSWECAPEQAYEIARKRIREAKTHGAKNLDLTLLSLRSLPPELIELTDLVEIAIGRPANGAPRDLPTNWQPCLRDIVPLGELPSLQTVRLCGCDSLIGANALAAIKQVERLDLSGCNSLRDASAFGTLQRLSALHLSECENLTSIAELIDFPLLRELDLGACPSLVDVRSLAKLPRLRILSLSQCRSLSDLRWVSNLDSLECLDLAGCESLKDLNGLEGLRHLRELDLSHCRALADISRIASLRDLAKLDVDGCTALMGMDVLGHLSGLRELHMRGSDAILDLGVLGGMAALKLLDLSWCRSLLNLSELKALRSLRSLNLGQCPAAVEFSWLGHLTELNLLDLTASRLTKAHYLSELRSLRVLNLSRCADLRDVSALVTLRELESLDLSGCRSGLEIKSLRASFGHLRKLYLAGGRFADLPQELCGERRGENVRDAVAAYFLALQEQSAMALSAAKVLLVGNGRAGKTTLARRLQKWPLARDEKSTHAVRLDAWSTGFMPIDASPEDPAEMAVLSLWDFGGQDIYHHTHRLFFQGSCVFVVVWNTVAPVLGPSDIADENPFLPLSYWLDQIRSLHPNPHIILVCNRRRQQPTKNETPVLVAGTGEIHDAGEIDLQEASEEEIDGIRWRIAAAVAKLLGTRQQRVRPRGWLSVSAELTRQQTEYTHRLREWEAKPDHLPQPTPQAPVLTLDEFKLIAIEHCQRDGHRPASDVEKPETLLSWLHRSGAVYYRPDRLHGRVLVEQRWAIHGIYALMDLSTSIPGRLREQRGRFVPSQIAEWQWRRAGYSPEQQALFVEFMCACGFAVEVLHGRETTTGEPLLLVPYFLPASDDPQLELAPSMFMPGAGEEELQVHVLHEAIGRDVAEAMIVHFVRHFSRSAVVWKYGVLISDSEKSGRASVAWQRDKTNPAAFNGRLMIRMIGKLEAVSLLLSVLRNEIASLPGMPSGAQWKVVNSSSADLTQRITSWTAGPGSKPEPEPLAGPSRTLTAIAGRRIDCVGRRIAISCAGDDRDNVGIEQAPKSLQWHLLAKPDVTTPITFYRAPQSIADIEIVTQNIAKADYRIVFLSKRYLYSEFCMAEFHQLFLAEPRGSFPREDYLLVRFASAKFDAKQWAEWASFWRQRTTCLSDELETYRRDGQQVGVAAGALVGNYRKQWLAQAGSPDFLRQIQSSIENYGFELKSPPVFDASDPQASYAAINRWAEMAADRVMTFLPHAGDQILLALQRREAAKEAARDGDVKLASVLDHRARQPLQLLGTAEGPVPAI